MSRVGVARGASPRIAAAAAAMAAGLLAVFAFASPASAQAASCGYGTAGPSASSLCWFDMSGYNDATARSAGGQQVSIEIPGGYTATFTLHSRPVAGATTHPAVAARTTPLENRFAFGSSGADGGYRSVPGSPALYSQPAAGATKGVELTLSNIQVVDSAAQPVIGYRFAIADSENNVSGENFTWTSDKPLNLIGVLNDDAPSGCNVPPGLAGVGTTTVTCTGRGGEPGLPDPRYDAVVVGADTPSTIGLSMTTFAQSGVAFAIQTSKIELNKQVVGRAQPTDSFDISVTSPEGSQVAAASTGPANSATTGELTVLPRASGATYTLADAATPASGTDLSDYQQSWNCTNNGQADPTLPAGGGTSVQVSPAAGDHIECTVTNAAPTPPLQTCPTDDQRATERFWFYGINAGIDFGTSGTTATKLVTPGSITSHEGTTVITDTAGRLRFWSNGQTVFNANHQAMPNGTGLQGNSSATQTVAAFPALGDPNKYFVVTTSAEVSLGTLRYSVVDMSLDGGLGAVTATKNVVLGPTGSASEALTAVPNEDGTGFWVLTYTPNSPNVRAYEFDASGPIGPSNGVVSVMPTDNLLGFGTLNPSPDLSQLVAMTGTRGANPERSKLRLLGFDAATGAVWQKAEWEPLSGTGSGLNGYSAEFSFSGDYVYATKIFSGGRLYRYDVASNTTGAQIKASEANIGSIGTNGGQVKRGPDGRMYVANANGTALSVVGDPDNPNPANVGFSSVSFTLPAGSSSRFGLPQLVTGCPIPPESDLEVTKSADPTSLEIGDNVTFELQVDNRGPDDSPAVTLTDTLPAGLTYLDGLSDSSCNPGPGAQQITCDLGAMPANGGTRTVEIVAQVQSGASNATIENTATVSGPNVDPEPDDNEDSASIEVGPASDLALTKSADPAVVNPGEQLTYTLVATNNGPDDESAATITDTLPAGVTYLDGLSDPSCEPGPGAQQVTCTLNAIANEGTRTVEVVVQANSDAGGTFPTNSATVSGAGTDTDPQNNTDDAEVRIRPYADLAIEKTVDQAVADPDGTVIYELTVSNNGDNNSPSATVTDTLPDGVTYLSHEGDCVLTLPQITCTLPAIASGDARTLHVTVTVDSDAGNTTQTNAASVTGPLNDPDPGNNSDEADIFVTPVSDLSLTKTAPATARAGQEITYELAYANAGPTASPSPTVITDTLPAGVSHVSDTESCNVSAPPQIISCEVDPVPAGGGGTVEVTVAIDPAVRGEIENTAEIDGPNTDSDPTNDSDDATTDVGAPLTDLAITKDADPAVADPGAPVIYTLTVTNNGPDASPPAEVTDSLPGGIAYVSDDADPPGCDTSALPKLICPVGTLADDASETIQIEVTVDPGAGGTVQTNTATVSGPGDDSDPSNDTDTADTQVTPLSDLHLTKTAPDGPFKPGDQIPYEFTVANDGPTESPATVVSDTLPEGLSYVSDDGGCDATAPPVISCDLGTLPSGDSRTFTITARLDRVTGDSVTNSARVTGENNDPDPGDDESSVQSATAEAPSQAAENRCFFGATVTILGTNEPEVIRGTPGRDVINGRRGNDVILGLEGNDLLCGGRGNDLIKAGPGDDGVKGSLGNDRIRGNLGDDWLRGAPGNDLISGHAGADRVMGNNGNDRLRGRRGGDFLLGGPGFDWGHGGPGLDKALSLERAFSVGGLRSGAPGPAPPS